MCVPIQVTVFSSMKIPNTWKGYREDARRRSLQKRSEAEGAG